jgi:hypothetical protein
MTGSALATTFSEVLDRPIRCEMLGVAELEERFKQGTKDQGASPGLRHGEANRYQ